MMLWCKWDRMWDWKVLKVDIFYIIHKVTLGQMFAPACYFTYSFVCVCSNRHVISVWLTCWQVNHLLLPVWPGIWAHRRRYLCPVAEFQWQRLPRHDRRHTWLDLRLQSHWLEGNEGSCLHDSSTEEGCEMIDGDNLTCLSCSLSLWRGATVRISLSWWSQVICSNLSKGAWIHRFKSFLKIQ